MVHCCVQMPAGAISMFGPGTKTLLSEGLKKRQPSTSEESEKSEEVVVTHCLFILMTKSNLVCFQTQTGMFVDQIFNYHNLRRLSRINQTLHCLLKQ